MVGEGDEQNIEIFHSPDILEEQRRKLNEFRRTRDEQKLDKSIFNLKTTCENGKENTIPYVMECLRAKATIGEITSAFEEVFGTWKPRI